MTESTTCKACSAPIVFVKTQKGKSMPLDAAGSDVGEWAIVRTTQGATMAYPWRQFRPSQGEILKMLEGRRQGKPYRFTCHFDTCPEAARFRRTR